MTAEESVLIARLLQAIVQADEPIPITMTLDSIHRPFKESHGYLAAQALRDVRRENLQKLVEEVRIAAGLS